MTDNLTTQTTVSTVPSGSIIATDDAGAGGHVQVVKLAISTDGSATALTADNTDGLLVNLGTNNDVTLATLPDTAAGDLAAINTATVATQAAVEGTLTVGSHAVTNAGTFVVQEDGAALTALQLIDDIVHVDDTATHATGTTKGAGIMAAATPTDGSIDANDIGMLAMSTDRRLHVDSQIVGQDADITIADGGNSITVDGTITELNSTAILADTASMDTNLGTLAGAVAGTEFQVDIVADGAGLATSANQLADGHNVTIDNAAGASAVNIQDGGNTITVDNGGTFATQATLQANSGVDIGDVDVTSIVPGTGATNLGKIEDAAHTTADVGVMALAVQQTADAALADTTGDYAPLQVDDTGYLKVNVKAGGGTGGTSATDDAAFTAGSGSGTPAMGFFSVDTVDSGDVGVLAMDASRRLLVSIEADNVGIGGGTQYTEDEATANPIVGTATLIERDDALTTVTPVEGDWIGLRGSAEGALWTQDFNSDAILADTTAILADTASIDTNMATVAGAVTGTEMQVDIVTSALPTGAATAANQLADGHNVTVDNASIAVTNGGTFVVQEDGAALTALQLLDDVVATLGTSTYLEATTKGNIIGAVRNDTLAALADTDNEIAPLQVNASGALYIQEGAALDVSGATVTVDGSGVTQPVSGTITETNSAAILADTASIDTNMATVAGAVAAGQMQVDIVADGAGLATAANQLADGHNVTVDNGAAGAAVNIQDGGNSITIDGTVTANLSATDNAVLDNIDAQTAGSETALELIDGAIIGPGEPSVDSYTQASINIAAAANQVLVSSAVNKQIWVYGIGFVLSVAGTVSFQDEDDTAITGIMPFAANSGMGISPSGNFSQPLWKLATNKDLEVDVVTAEMDGWVSYAIVDVS